MTDRLRLVCATRWSQNDFWEKSLLGRSLSLFPDALCPKLAITFDNRPSDGARAEGLSTIYNRAIEQAEPSTNLLFVHDDVFIHDIFLVERLVEAFKRFDVVGLAGSRGGSLDHPSWALAFDQDLGCLGWQKGVHFSGAVSHTIAIEPRMPEPQLGVYGPVPDFCTLLDGLFLAVKTAAIGKSDAERRERVRFDERFDFHLYDIDFCRSATDAGLLLGTWPILVTHGSGGDFGAPAWKAAARQYLAKWNARDFDRAIHPASL